MKRFFIKFPKHPLFAVWLSVAVLLSNLSPVAAQFIDPTAIAPGGRTATFLDTSATSQKKLGSLLIGDGAGSDMLCLNGTGPADCISSWLNLAGALGGPFVRLYENQVVNPTLLASYNAFLQNGMAALQGVGATAAPTFTSNADAGSLKVGLYSSDGYDPTSYAARFGGRLSITNHTNVTNDPGQVCLNATTAYNPAGPLPRYGCITNWTDLGSGTIGAYVHLQTSNPPALYELGSSWVGTSGSTIRGAWNVDSAVVGGATTGGVSNQHCGDGLCSLELFEGPPFNFCPADCS